MKKIFFTALTLALFSNSNLKAQYLKAEGQEYMNKFSLAPAFAGYNGNDEAFLGYRTNMSGIEGATKLLTVDVNGDLGSSMGYGVGIINEKSGNFSNLYAGVTYAYHIRFSDESGLSFAVTPAVIRSSYNFLGAKTSTQNTDPVFASEAGLSGTGFDAGFSFMLNLKGLYFSAYVPRLICQDLKFQNGILNTDRQIFANLSYAIEADKWELEPSAEILYNLGAGEMEWKGGITAKYNQRAWLSVGYNSEKWVNIGMGFSATNRIAVAYQYVCGTSEIAKNCNGTHEISVGFLIQKAKNFKKPTIFFEEQGKAKQSSDPEIQNLKKQIKELEEEIQAAKKNGVLKDDDNSSTNPEPQEVVNENESQPSETETHENSKEWEMPIDMHNVTFAFGTAKLNKSSYPGIDTYIYLLNANTDQPISQNYVGRRVLIMVYTDQGGSKSFNKKLANERAEAIKAYMISKGVSEDRISTRAIGKSADSKNAEERFENNCVKICRSKK